MNKILKVLPWYEFALIAAGFIVGGIVQWLVDDLKFTWFIVVFVAVGYFIVDKIIYSRRE